MSWHTLVDPEFSGRLCLTLLHSLWQVVLLAAAARGIDWLWGRRSVERSYALHVAALLVGLAAGPITYAILEVGPRAEDQTQTAAARPTQALPLMKATPAQSTVQPMIRDDLAAAPPTTADVPEVAEASPTMWLHVAPWMVALNVAGVLVMFVRLALGMWSAHRFAARAELLQDGPLVDLLRSLARNWSLRVVPALRGPNES